MWSDIACGSRGEYKGVAYEDCDGGVHPRRGILQGTFNPEVFTAALGPVMQFYRSGSGAIDSIYTDAEAFSGNYIGQGHKKILA